MEATTETRTCALCQKEITDRYVETWSGDKLTRVVCSECDRNERYASFAATSRMTTWLVSDASMVVWHADEAREPRMPVDPMRLPLARHVKAQADALLADVKHFESTVWFGGLQRTVRKSRYKGMSAAEPVASPFGPVQVLSFTMAGRALVTLETGDHSVSLITAEDESTPRMGINGIGTTAAVACTLMRTVAAAWERGEVKMVDDTGVTTIAIAATRPPPDADGTPPSFGGYRVNC